MHLDDAILHHLESTEIRDQATLLDRLQAEGHVLTLSTLCRRLSRLNVRKARGVYRQLSPNRGAGEAISLRKVPPCLLIMKTSPGTAQALAVALDHRAPSALGGSVSGYDTIFIAPTDPSRLDELEEEVRRFLESNPRGENYRKA